MVNHPNRTAAAKTRRRQETIDQKYDRLTRRVVRQLPITAAESRWLWTEKSRRMRLETK